MEYHLPGSSRSYIRKSRNLSPAMAWLIAATDDINDLIISRVDNPKWLQSEIGHFVLAYVNAENVAGTISSEVLDRLRDGNENRVVECDGRFHLNYHLLTLRVCADWWNCVAKVWGGPMPIYEDLREFLSLPDPAAAVITEDRSNAMARLLWREFREIPFASFEFLYFQIAAEQRRYELSYPGADTKPPEPPSGNNDTMPPPPDHIIRALTPRSREILEFMWYKGNVNRNDLRAGVWPGREIADKSIGEAVRLLNSELIRFTGYSVTAASGGLFFLKNPFRNDAS